MYQAAYPPSTMWHTTGCQLSSPACLQLLTMGQSPLSPVPTLTVSSSRAGARLTLFLFFLLFLSSHGKAESRVEQKEA